MRSPERAKQSLEEVPRHIEKQREHRRAMTLRDKPRALLQRPGVQDDERCTEDSPVLVTPFQGLAPWTLLTQGGAALALG